MSILKIVKNPSNFFLSAKYRNDTKKRNKNAYKKFLRILSLKMAGRKAPGGFILGGFILHRYAPP
jgi:hypothetical protein